MLLFLRITGYALPAFVCVVGGAGCRRSGFLSPFKDLQTCKTVEVGEAEYESMGFDLAALKPGSGAY